MIKVITEKAETIPAGTVLCLTPEQAQQRVPFLNPMGDGVYIALREQQFKAGEEIGFPDVYEPEPGVIEVIPEPPPVPTKKKK